MSIEAMKQALEALEGSIAITMAKIARRNEAITALRAAIDEASMQRLTDVQQEIEQEPVAWLQMGGPLHDNIVIARTDKPKEWNPEWWRFEPLYPHPPRREWVGMTEVDPSVEQLDQIIDLLARTHVRISARELLRVWIVAYTRAIEAKLKEKNT